MKVIAVDLDGTLLDSQKQLGADMRELIGVLRSKGYLFGVATGRPYFSALAAIPNPEELLDFLITDNGGEIQDYVANRSHQQYPISGDLVREIITENMALGANPVLNHNDELVMVDEGEYYNNIKKILKTKIDPNIMDYVKESQAKVIFSVDEETAQKVMAYHTEKNDPRYHFFKSQKELLEFMDPRVNKEVGLEWFCDYHKIELSQVMAFGDNDNDYEMIQAAGIGVAMSNATDLVKSAADHIAKSNDEQGVYHFLKDYLSN